MHVHTDKAASLVAIASPVAERIEMRQAFVDKGLSKIRSVTAIELPAGKDVILEPTGQHAVLFNLKAELKEGDKVPVTLTIERGGTKQSIQTNATVKAAPPAGHKHDEKGKRHAH